MAPRRPHKKSRYGCDQCKSRRIKCDEQGPPCANCIARAKCCSYSGLARDHRQTSVTESILSSPVDSIASRDVRPNPLLSPQGAATSQRLHDHLTELELIHHYTAQTWRSFCHNFNGGPEAQERETHFLQFYIPKASLQYEFALNGLLAITALHKATSELSCSVSDYLEIAIKYQSRSQTFFNVAIQHLNEDNCHMVLATTLSYLVLGAALPRYLPEKEKQSSALDHIFTIRKLFRGSWEVLGLYKEPLMTGPFRDFFAVKEMSVFPECLPHTKSALQRLRILHSSFIYQNSETAAATLLLIDKLEHAFKRRQSGVRISCFGWLLTTSNDFITEVDKGSLVPCLILMHWTVLLHRSSDLWWVPSHGPVLLDEIAGKITVTRYDEQEAMLWCRREIDSVPST